MLNKDRRFVTFIFLIILLGPVRSLISGGFSGLLDEITSTLYMLPGIAIGLSFHEYGHAKAADYWGDPSPRYQGRLTLDPRAHIDLMGLLCLLFIHFGWGRPVAVNPDNFRNRKKGTITVGLAGVTVNFLTAFAFGGIIKLIYLISPNFYSSSIGKIVGEMLLEVVIINISLMLFNLIPVPPLDGFGVIAEVFNLYRTKFYYFVSRYSWFILMAVILLDIPSYLISTPLVRIVNFIMSTVFKLNWWYFLM